MPERRQGTESPLGLTLKTAAASFAVALPMLYLAGPDSTLITVWFVPAVTVLFAHRPLRWGPVWGALGVLLGTTLANLSTELLPVMAVTGALGNAVYALLTLTLLRRFVGPVPWTIRQLATGTALTCAAGTALVLPLLTIVMAQLDGHDGAALFAVWAGCNVAGTLLLLPTIWLLRNSLPDERIAPATRAALWLATLGTLVVVSNTESLPLLFLPALPLVYFGLFGQARQGMVALLVVCLGILVATHLGRGPIGLINAKSVLEGAEVLQLYISTTCLTTFSTAYLFHELRCARDALARSESLANQANLAKTRFLANMSHELRTPIAAIVGFTRLLKDGSLSPAQRSYVERIQTGSEHLRAVIGDILDFSRIEEGALEMEVVDFDLHALAYACASLIGGQLHQGVHLDTEIGPDVPQRVRGVEVRLRQVLINLLNNAAKFTEQGQVMLQVRRKDGAAEHVEFLVRDTGCGIPADAILGLMEGFEQRDGGLARPQGGRGLGLTISHHLIRAMGGELTLDSLVDLGTVVRFSLPLPAVARAPEVAPQAPQPRSALPGPVLLVDDDPIMAELAALQLAQLDYEVLAVTSAQEALARVKAGGVGFLVTDLHMPGMDGCRLLRLARAEDPELRAALMTADATPQARDLAYAAGFEQVLLKPITPEAFAAAIGGGALYEAETPGAPTPGDLDMEALEDLADFVGEKELGAFLARSLDQFSSLLDELDAGEASPDRKWEVAHQIRGTSGNLGLSKVTAFAALLEDTITAGEPTAAHIDALRRAVRDAREASMQAGLLPEPPRPRGLEPVGLRLLPDPEDERL